MGILSADNNISYTANNACRIYIIKQVEFKDIPLFNEDYISYINSQNNTLKQKLNKINPMEASDIKLIPLISYDIDNILNYEEIKLDTEKPDCPRKLIYTPSIDSKGVEGFEISFGDKYESLWFYRPLFALRNCPLIDFAKPTYVFQIDGQLNSGIGDVVSFTTSFSVNGQSSCEISLNNRDFKYNFKYFDDDYKYKWHLKPFFDTNDIIIVRFQKKNTNKDSLLNSFRKQQIDFYEDIYRDSDDDPFITLFTGYINDVNSAFNYANGTQTMSLNCTGPSKKLTWTRMLSNNAVASSDSGSALIPLSAYINPQTTNEEGKVSLENKEILKNLLVRTMSGVLNIPAVKEAGDKFIENFDKNKNILTDGEYQKLLKKVKNATDRGSYEKYQKQVSKYKSSFEKNIEQYRKIYNDTIRSNMKDFSSEDEESGTVKIWKNTFLPNDIKTPLFEINGTKQPAYQFTFNDFNNLFQSTFSTIYQFIKGIADNLQFNFYDDPYGIIHFSMPNLTLVHLQSGNHPNNINQLVSFTESQSTENIANVQYASAKSIYNLDLSMINTVVKDYASIIKYGEKMMQPFEKVGITDLPSIKYAAKMQMTKYNRKALSNIKVNIVGEPGLKLDKYAYFKPLRKLFYIESYSHSYTAGGNFVTNISGTYTRDILAIAESTLFYSDVGTSYFADTTNKNSQEVSKNIIKSSLLNVDSIDNYLKTLDDITFVDKETLNQKIYDFYVNTFGYPKNDEGLKLEINAMYTPDNIKQCLLDGFFWALPFDADPYSTILELKKKEQENKSKLQKTEVVYRKSKTEVQEQNKKEADINYCPTAQSIYNKVDILSRIVSKNNKYLEKIDFLNLPSLLDIRKQVNKIFLDISNYRRKNLLANKEWDEKYRKK